MSQSQVKFDSLTREKISGHLVEYTTTLKEVTESIEHVQTRAVILITFIASTVSVAAGLFSYGWVRFQSTGNAFFWIAGGCTFLVTALFFRLYYSSRLKSRLVARQSAVVGLKLEKIMQLASQMLEHGDLNATQRLELELRLVEAEGALQFVPSTVRSRDENTSR